MILRFVEAADWPELAWLARCSTVSEVVTVWHGRGVETRNEFFCEAAWPGNFDEGGFDRVEIVAGTGGRLRADKLTFVSASSTVDRLQTLQLDDAWFVSNSLSCLLRATGARLRPSYPRYNRLFSSIQFGLDRYDRYVESSRGPIQLVYYDHVRWDGSELRRVSRPDDAPDFVDFRTYVTYLQRVLDDLASNGRAAGRRRRFDLLATVSSGYDSPAAATLGRRAGCTQAICIDKGQRGVDDSGRAVAEHLGLGVIDVRRDAWLGFDAVEARNAAGGYLGSVILSGAEDELPYRIVLTGFHGDKVWAHDGPNPDPSIVRGDCSGLGLTEYRLWARFLHLPVPFCGVRKAGQIVRISRSAEMQPFLISGSSYNRPIPRRIAEEAGVPRGIFGMRKAATDLRAWEEREFLSPGAFADYQRWLKENRGSWYRRFRLPPIRNAAADNALHRLNVLATRGVNRLAGVARRLSRLLPSLRRINWAPYIAMVPKQINLRQYYVPWAIERVTEAYSWPVGIAADSSSKEAPPEGAQRRTLNPDPAHPEAGTCEP